MAELRLKSRRFREEREADWRRLDALMEKVDRKGARALSDADLQAIPVLYRATLSSLSVARATSLDRGTTDYLEALATRAYFFVYGARSTMWERLARFLVRDWPNAVQALWRETAVSLSIFLVGAVTSYWLVSRDKDWYFSFVPAGLVQGRDPATSTEALRATLYDHATGEGLSTLAAMLFTHNSTVALFCFALGFIFCLPTVGLIASTGCMFGAFLALFASRGLGWEAGGWLMIHGVTELSAIIIAGGAGLRIGWTLAFPGERSRMQAATEAGRTSATAMAGVVIMLIVAGCLEGFARQLITQDAIRWSVAVGSGLLWAIYFYTPRRAAP